MVLHQNIPGSAGSISWAAVPSPKIEVRHTSIQHTVTQLTQRVSFLLMVSLSDEIHTCTDRLRIPCSLKDSIHGVCLYGSAGLVTICSINEHIHLTGLDCMYLEGSAAALLECLSMSFAKSDLRTVTVNFQWHTGKWMSGPDFTASTSLSYDSQHRRGAGSSYLMCRCMAESEVLMCTLGSTIDEVANAAVTCQGCHAKFGKGCA